MILAVATAGGLVVIACTHSLISGPRSRTRTVALLGMLLYVLVLLLRPSNLIVSNVALLLAATSVGATIGYVLGSRGAILLFCLVMAVIDSVSFNEGLTRGLLQVYASSDGDLLRYVALTIPIDDRILPVIGFGDLLVLSALHSGLYQLAMPTLLSVTALLASLIVAVFVGLSTGGVPALPVIAAGAAILMLARPSIGRRR